MIVNTEYQDIIDKVNKIRSYGLNKMLTIPQIAILGDQSSGKSSVLEALTQLSFPRNIETCTRFATQVSLRQSEQVEMSAYIDGNPEFNKKYHAQKASWNIHTIINEANNILCSSVEISDKVLEITISGPTLSPLTVIDLPGYINTTVDGQDKNIVNIIRAINTRYIKDSRTIILAVVPANVDLNNIYVLGQAETYDQSNERTIPIVTKPDTIEADLIPSLIQTLLNKRKYMKLGYLVMKNSNYKDINIPWDQARQREDEFFKSSPLWAEIPDTRKGRVSAKTFLGDILYSHIKKELPLLKKEVLTLISDCEKEINSMGLPVSSAAMAKIKYFDIILKLKTSLTAVLNGNYSFEYISKHRLDFNNQHTASAINNHDINTGKAVATLAGHNGDKDDDCAPLSLDKDVDRIFIRASLQRLYHQYNIAMNKDKYMLQKDRITELVLRYKGNELPGFISFTTFTQIYMETLVQWTKITEAHISNMNQFLYKAITRFITSAADPLIKDTLCLEFEKFYNSQITKIKSAIESIFMDESNPFTMNKYYYDNILKIRKTKAEQDIQQMVNNVQGNSSFSSQCVKDLLQQKLQSYGKVTRMSEVDYNEQLAVEDLQEQLRSYCKVAHKRIVDIVLMQTIERYMIMQINLYFDMLIALDDNTISNCLIEPSAKRVRRQELESKVAVLQKSLREL
ncbi:hypothetical protein BGX27_000982 [Mortierella sp. AM989]|nr:hypothetical protein BGX27_000982 [Mortierella sp. AM989]